MALTAKKVYAILKRQISDMESKLNSPVRYRGTVATADLLPLNPDIGDMYNIESKSIYGEAGMNVAWNGVVWDTMGAPIDMSLYLTKEEAETVMQRLVTEYFEKNPVKPGATAEQAQQIEQNKTDIASLKTETGSLKEDLDDIQEIFNYVKIVDGTYAVKGVTIVLNGDNQTITVSGTSTSTGGRDVLYNRSPLLLKSGTYRLKTIPSAPSNINVCVFDKNYPFPTTIKGDGIFTLTEEKELYIGVNIEKSNTSISGTFSVIVESGASITEFSKNNSNAVDVIARGNNLIGELFNKTCNMFNKKDTRVLYDTFITTDRYATASGLRVTHPIKVNSGDIIKFIKDDALGGNYLYAYVDFDGSLVSTINPPSNAFVDGYMEITVPYDGFVAFNLGRADINSFMVCKKEEYPTEYVNYGHEYTDDFVDNILNKKTWYACGDSFTHGDFSGDIGNTNQEITSTDPEIYDKEWGMYKTYPWWIARRNNMNLKNLAYNGGTLAVPTKTQNNTHPFTEQIMQNIGSDADYITIWYGINDCYYDDLGTIDDTTPNTFYGAWNKALAYLIENHPYAKIGIICSASNPTVGLPYRNATRECAQKWGIPYLDQMGDDKIPLMLYGKESEFGLCEEAINLRKNAFIVSSTNTHPNIKAHKYQSTFIEHWLRSL